MSLPESRDVLLLAISRFAAAKNHTIGYLFHRFADALETAPEEVKPVLTNLCCLYGLYNIQENAGNFLQYHYFTSKQIDMVKEKVVCVLCHIVSLLTMYDHPK